MHQSLFVGETYTIEVPATVQLQMAKKDFVVTSEGHVVSVVLARRVGRVMVHLLPGESDLPVPTSVMLQLKRRGLDQRVMPAFPVGADRAELHGEDTLLVGETYELSASANGAIIPTSTDFVVADGQVVQVQLPIERAMAVVSLIFRAQPPPVPEAKSGKGGGGGSSSSVAYRAASIELPEGLVYEVRHKATERAVAQGRLSAAEADAMTDQIASKPNNAARCEAMRRTMRPFEPPSAGRNGLWHERALSTLPRGAIEELVFLIGAPSHAIFDSASQLLFALADTEIVVELLSYKEHFEHVRRYALSAHDKVVGGHASWIRLLSSSSSSSSAGATASDRVLSQRASI